MPETFGRYELGELLGRGGMGEVYRARDTVRERWVALKVLPPHLASDESFTARFRRESRLAAQLNEPHIIPIHDFGEIDGRLFIDMRLVQGRDLSSVLETDGPLLPEVAVEIVGQMAAALDAAHADDLIHRDVKPSNVLLTGLRDDPTHVPFAYLVDFGIARSTAQDMTALTGTAGTAIGTLAYMSPERIYGQTGDGRGDVYALACVLYETLTGRPPFDGEPFALMFAHVNTPPPAVRETRPDLPAALDEVITTGLAKSPDDRYRTAGDFAAAARRAVRLAATDRPGPAAPPSTGPTQVLPRPPAATPPPTPPPSGTGPWTPPPTPPPSGTGPWTPPPTTGPSTSPPTARPTPPPQQPPPQPHPTSPPYRPPADAPSAAATLSRQDAPTQASHELPTVHIAGAPTPPAGSIPPPPRSTAPWAAPGRPPPPPRRSRKRIWIVLAAVIVIGLAAVGVVLLTRGDEPSPKAGSSGGGGSSTSAAAQLPLEQGIVTTDRAAVKTGGTLTFPILSKIENYNYFAPDGHTDSVRRLADILLPRPFATDPDGTPAVDTNYFTAITTESTDPLTVRYSINPRAVWSDGTPLTYRDIAGQADALGGKKGFRIPRLVGYDRVQSVRRGDSDREAIVTFSPYADWQSLFAPLLPSSLTKDPTTFANAWKDAPQVTAGPFSWSAADARGYHVVRSPTTKWWGDQAKLDSITLRAYVTLDDALAALGRREVDAVNIGGPNAAQNIATLRTFRGVSLRYATATNYRLFALNTRDPVLADPVVRVAFAQALDRGAIRDAVTGSLASSAPVLQNHFLADVQPGYAETCGAVCSADPTAAKTALQKDGWTLTAGVFTKNGRRLALRILVPTDQPDARIEATAAATSLRAAGIQLDLSMIGESAYSTALAGGAFQVASLGGSSSVFPLLVSMARYEFTGKNSSSNPAAGGSADINDLMARALVTPDRSARDALLNRASTDLWANAAYLPLYRRPQLNAVVTGLVNFGSPGLASVRWQDIGYRS